MTNNSDMFRNTGRPDPSPAAPPSGEATVSVRPAQFAALRGGDASAAPPRNLGLLMDISLNVVAELGRTRMKIRDVLGLTPGSIIELDKVAGEPINVMVNGALIARGEVVVVDEQFGIRILEIVASPGDLDLMGQQR